MIDISKCVFEESFRDGTFGRDVYFFTYPTDLTLARFDIEPDDNVIAMCIELAVYDGGGIEFNVSPTVENSDGSCEDVDWHPLEDGLHINYDDAEKLVMLAHDCMDYFTVVHQNPKLEDNETSTGGTAICGETLKEFLEGFSFTKLSSLNRALDACGIKPVSPK